MLNKDGKDIEYLYLDSNMDLIENASIVESANRHPWELARYDIIKKNVNKISRNPEANFQVVDIGCGDAYVISRLHTELSLSRAIGVDINFSEEHLLKLDGNVVGIDFYRDFHEIQVSEDGEYLILLNDVLEHIEDDLRFFTSVVNHFKLAKSLIFYVTVPAFQFVFSQHDIDLLHYRRYTLKSLGALGKKYQLEISERGYFFFGLLTIRTVQFLLEKLKSKSNSKESSIGVNHWNRGRVITRLVTSILYLDYLTLRCFSIVGVHIPGLSAWSIFTYRKQ